MILPGHVHSICFRMDSSVPIDINGSWQVVGFSLRVLLQRTNWRLFVYNRPNHSSSTHPMLSRQTRVGQGGFINFPQWAAVKEVLCYLCSLPSLRFMSWCFWGETIRSVRRIIWGLFEILIFKLFESSRFIFMEWLARKSFRSKLISPRLHLYSLPVRRRQKVVLRLKWPVYSF